MMFLSGLLFVAVSAGNPFQESIKDEASLGVCQANSIGYKECIIAGTICGIPGNTGVQGVGAQGVYNAMGARGSSNIACHKDNDVCASMGIGKCLNTNGSVCKMPKGPLGVDGTYYNKKEANTFKDIKDKDGGLIDSCVCYVNAESLDDCYPKRDDLNLKLYCTKQHCSEKAFTTMKNECNAALDAKVWVEEKSTYEDKKNMIRINRTGEMVESEDKFNKQEHLDGTYGPSRKEEINCDAAVKSAQVSLSLIMSIMILLA